MQQLQQTKIVDGTFSKLIIFQDITLLYILESYLIRSTHSSSRDWTVFGGKTTILL